MRTLRWTTPLALLAFAAAPAGAQEMGTMHGSGSDGTMMGQSTMQMCPMGSGAMTGQQGMAGGGMAGMAGHQGMMAGGGMAGMNPAMGGAAVLFGGVDLGLSADQQTELDALVTKAREEHQAHMQAAMAVQSGAAEALAGADPDLQAYERSLQEAATHMVQAHVAVAGASVDARALLTPGQLAKLPEGAQLMNAMMCGMTAGGMMDHGSMMGGQPGVGGHEQHHR
jgi:hypothetical protein